MGGPNLIGRVTSGEEEDTREPRVGMRAPECRPREDTDRRCLQAGANPDGTLTLELRPAEL